jgi:hypothetical protein
MICFNAFLLQRVIWTEKEEYTRTSDTDIQSNFHAVSQFCNLYSEPSCVYCALSYAVTTVPVRQYSILESY